MENNLTVTKEKGEALELHNRILINANMACSSWVETCKCLKQMRDTKLYTELGYEKFEDYTTKALGIKERQAYTYISAYENLGEQFLQSNATVGITKLSLLAAVPPTERQGIVESNDLAGMTVEEVKRLVKENDEKGEQIDLLTAELSTAKTSVVEKDEEIRALQTELSEERNKPVTVAVQEPDKETIERIKQEAIKQANAENEKVLKEQKKTLTQKFKEDSEKAASEAAKKAEEKIKDYEKKLAEVDTERAKALTKAQELEKKLAVSASPETVKFTFYFEALQADYNKLIDSLKKIKSENPDTAEKYIAAMVKFKAIVDNRIKEI